VDTELMMGMLVEQGCELVFDPEAADVLVAVNAVVDYAKVRAVVEDRRSMVGALVAALRFVRRNAAAVFGLYLLDAAVFVALLIVYALVAPGACCASRPASLRALPVVRHGSQYTAVAGPRPARDGPGSTSRPSS
jgi:hypothetical protein